MRLDTILQYNHQLGSFLPCTVEGLETPIAIQVSCFLKEVSLTLFIHVECLEDCLTFELLWQNAKPAWWYCIDSLLIITKSFKVQ